MSEPLVILDPTAGPAASVAKRAPRLDTLDGKVIGLLDNTKLNADRFIAHLAAALRREHPTAEFVVRRKAGASRPAAPELLDELAARCDAVVAAVGD
ncbi:MAG: hypothetical protein M0Z94_10620 [Dehalococcoidales bacterium]|nr:hypothetical protein [Dehalococcoidales bacterium]